MNVPTRRLSLDKFADWPLLPRPYPALIAIESDKVGKRSLEGLELIERPDLFSRPLANLLVDWVRFL